MAAVAAIDSAYGLCSNPEALETWLFARIVAWHYEKIRQFDPVQNNLALWESYDFYWNI